MEYRISKIFEERPDTWGLRGDPYLWNDLEKYFSDKPIPCIEEEFKNELQSIFIKYTGANIDSKENIYVPKYSKGGMSSGMVSCNFWLNTALPILIARLQELNKINM